MCKYDIWEETSRHFVHQKYNAQLIAAAPELLDAAFKSLHWCNKGITPEEVNEFKEELENLIKKIIE